jgi:hypothetical protein
MKPVSRSGDSAQSSNRLDSPAIDFNAAPFVSFSARMDSQLEELVAKWQHLAAPRALRVGRSCLPDSAEVS